MTEEEWLSEVRPLGMLLFVREQVSERKVLLFNCACCRRIWTCLGEEDRNAVTQLESSADDPVATEKLRLRYKPPPPQYHTGSVVMEDGRVATYTTPIFQFDSAPSSDQTNFRRRLDGHRGHSIGSLAHAAANVAAGEPEDGRNVTRALSAGNVQLARAIMQNPLKAAEEEEQAKLVRDIFGNPFRPVAFDPAWRTDTAVSLARQMYDSRDFGAMPILADSLQDAGCDSADILDHCRDFSLTHVRGCWVVDLVLGKE